MNDFTLTILILDEAISWCCADIESYTKYK